MARLLLHLTTHMTPDWKFCFSLPGATTAEAWTTTPKSASYRPSPRSAISARALTTWLPAAQSKHSSPRRVLRENHPPQKETWRNTATWRRLLRALIKTGNGETEMPGKHRGQSNCFDGEMGHMIPFLLLKLLLELPQVKRKIAHEEDVFFLVCLSFGVTLRNTAVLLHSGRFLNVWITVVLWGE